MHDLKLFAAVLPVLLALDALWLGLVMNRFYDAQLGALARRVGPSLTPHWPSAIMVYLLLAAGIVLFALPKAGGDHLRAAIWGGIFGLVVYGVYDLTNLATLADWPLRLTVVDMIWGAILCGVTTLVASQVATMVK